MSAKGFPKGEIAMKNQATNLRIIILMILMAVLLLPQGVVLAQDEEDDEISELPHEIFFWIFNHSQFDFTLDLYGPTEYSLTVPPDSTGFFVIKNGWYAFTMYYCNMSETGTLDLTNHKNMISPICGGTGGATGQSYTYYDASDYIRPAQILVRNRTLQPIEVYIRTLEEHHFLSFEPLEERFIHIEDASQDFAFSYVACDELIAGMTRLYIRVPFDLMCDN